VIGRALRVGTVGPLALLAAIIFLTPVYGGVCDGGTTPGSPCVSSCPGGGTCVECTQPPPGMLAWWPADGSTVDRANGNDGTLLSGATYGTGRVGQAFDLDGSDDLVRCGTSALLRPTNALTLDAWVFLRTLSAGDVVSYNFSSNMGYQLVFGGNPLALVGQLGDGTNDYFLNLQVPITQFVTNRWYHLALTFDGAMGRLYVDGILKDSFAKTTVLQYTNARECAIGASLDNGPGSVGPYGARLFFSGRIDEVEILDRALSQSEILAIFNAGPAGKCKCNPDAEPPAIHCPSPVGVIADAQCQAVPFGAQATDNCGPAQISANPPVMTGVGVHPVVYTATDSSALSASCQTSFQIADGTPPTLACPPDQTLSGDANCLAQVPAATATDNCDPNPTVTPSQTSVSGGGTHPVTYTGMDADGNSIQCTTNYTLVCSPCTPPPANMMDWWTFDETSGPTSSDRAHFNNAGTDQGAVGHVPAMVGNGINLNGNNQYVQVPDQSDVNFGSGDLTIDAWVNTTDVNGVVPIVDKRSMQPTGYQFYVINGVLGFQLADGAGACNCNCGGAGTCCTNFSAPSAGPNYRNVADGNWHHVAVTVDRNLTGSLYVDGFQVLAFNPTQRQGSLTNTSALWVGRTHPTTCVPTSQYFTGRIDELEMFNRALTQTEIQALFNAGANGKCKCVTPPAGMADWWRFDEAAGATTSADSAVYNNAGSDNGGFSYGPAVVGNGAYLNGTTGFSDVPDHLEVDFGVADLSIDAWVNTTNTGTQPIVDKRTNRPLGYELYLVGGRPTFQLADGANGCNCSCTGLGSCCTNWTAPVTANIADGAWHHVAVTVRRSSATGGHIYVDGAVVLQFDPTGRQGNVDNASNLWIGRSHANSCTPETYLAGGLDEVEMFPRELTAAEVQTLFRAGRAGKCRRTPCAEPTIYCKNFCPGPSTNWLSLPAVSCPRSAEDLCAEIPLVSSVSQRYSNELEQYTYNCSTGACTTTSSAPIPEPSSACVSSCFCVDPGEGFEVVTTGASRYQIKGTDASVTYQGPAGTYLISIPFHTPMVNAAALYNAMAPNVVSVTRLVCPGVARQTWTGFSGVNFPLEPGTAYEAHFSAPFSFNLPFTPSPPAAPYPPCACPDNDGDGYYGSPAYFGCAGGQDCNDANSTVWSLPGEPQDLKAVKFIGSELLTWNPPWNPGGTAQILYDVVASLKPNDFVDQTCPPPGACATCMPPNDSPATSRSGPIPNPPGPGKCQNFIVRAQNPCGEGPVGVDRFDNPLQGRPCP